MAWEFHNNAPVFLQIVERIRGDIISGKYPPGSPFPPVRQLAAEAAVNPNTMQRALSELENQGLLEGRGTVGRFVTSDGALLTRTNASAKEKALNELLEKAETLGITGEEIIAFVRDRKMRKEGKNDV